MFPVKQVPEQYDENPPESISCTIKTSSYGIFIEQDYISLIKKHYDVGREQIFDIIRVQPDCYELIDSWGYTAYADREFNIDTSTTSKVRCIVKSINGKHPAVEILEVLPMETDGLVVHRDKIKKILSIYNEDYDDVLDLMLQDVSSELYDLKCMGWLSQSLSEINKTPELLHAVVDICKNLLEDCDFLMELSKEKRAILSKRLTSIIENINFFSSAKTRIEENSASDYIESILSKLSLSGHLYHPREQFHQLLYIFMLDANLMEQYTKQIFSTVRNKEITFWQETGLAPEWIILFEYYCKYTDSSLNETFENNRKGNIIQALGLQIALTDDSTTRMYDARLNRSMLYRHASEMEVQKPKMMLDIAYKNLVGTIESSMASIIWKNSDSKLISNVLFNQYDSADDKQFVPLLYKGEKTIIKIDYNGITILPKDIDYIGTENALSSSMNLWKNIQVRVPNRIKNKQTDNISRTTEIWNEIDKQLFNREVLSPKLKAGKTYFGIGDTVNFIVRRQTSESTFSCDILDHGIAGHAIIDIEDIVKYRVDGVSISAFKVDNGQSKILKGSIKNIDSDGNYHLSMNNFVNSSIAKKHKNDWEEDNDFSFLCRLHYYNQEVGRYIGVDDCGISVSVKVNDEETPWSSFEKGSILEVGYPDKQIFNGFIQCEFISVSDERMPGIVDCFSALMDICCAGQYYPTEEVTTENIEEVFHPLPIEHVGELISLIESVAGLENDYIKAYNYFGICRTLSKIINSEPRTEYYDNRLKLIRLLYTFNDTGTVNENELQKIENENADIFSQHTQLHFSLFQLKIVSYLSKSDFFSDLSQMLTDESNKELVTLINLVISHNLLKKEGMTNEATSIRNQIIDLLKLQRRETNKKYYGEESQSVEFKPSMVFPPEQNMQPNLGAQTHEILEQICAFLNCGGGTLYIGVANTGYEFGLSQDLQYKEFSGSKDMYTLHLNNNIHDKLGNVASRYVRWHWDEDIESDVLVVEVSDCDEVVSLDGEYYERRGTSVRYANDRESFRKFRQQQIDSKKTCLAEVEETPSDTPAEEHKIVTATKANVTPIFTSQLRNNVLHDFEDGYEDAIGYLGFLSNGKYIYQSDEMWGEEERPLTLVIHESERKNYLICIYEGGYISKIPISEILDKTEGNEYVRCTEKQLVFASIASKNDSIMSILSNSKGEKYIRFDKVSNYEDGRMSDYGTILTGATFEEAIQFEVIPTIEIKDFKVTSTQKSIGAIIKTSAGKEAYEYMKAKGVLFF